MNYRVVIVDDAPFVREVLGHILRSSHFEIVGEAADGEEAVRVARETNPDLIIMDIVMPKKSGIQATIEILETHPDIKIVACSTEGGENIVTKAIEAGCVDYIVKPFEQKALLEVLNSVLSGKKSSKGVRGE